MKRSVGAIALDKARPKDVTDEAIATRLYEICVAQGYVDSRDWADVTAQLEAEQQARSKAIPALPTAVAGATSKP